MQHSDKVHLRINGVWSHRSQSEILTLHVSKTANINNIKWVRYTFKPEKYGTFYSLFIY